MNTSQLKLFAIRSRQILKEGVLNRIISLGFDIDGNLTVDRPQKIGGGTVFLGQIREEEFHDAWVALEARIAAHDVKEVCEEAAYTWFNRLVAIRIMQKNGFIEPVMAYTNETTRIPVIVDEARSGRLSMQMNATERAKLDELLKDPTKTNEQFNLLISSFCESNPVIFNCFGGIDKHIGLLLPDNILAQDGFIDLLNHTPYLTDDDYRQSELIGWLYQFYISEKKDEVFAKKGKYDPDEIPAATQIFTPNWIVKYMVQNTLGRIYLDNNPYSELDKDMKYLVKTDEKTPEDAILKITDMEGYTLIDPACGSGHILVEAFDLLFRMYQDEAYPVKAAITSILTKNIIGIDLDTRAKQLAMFALLMKACQKDRSFLDCKVLPRVLDMPEPFVYEGGLMKEFLAHFFLGGNKKIIEETEKALELMKDADTLGSIMKFDISNETRAAIKKSTEQWEQQEFANPHIKAVIPSMKVILALTDKYATTVMNPPYMGSGKFDLILSDYVNRFYEEGKADLYAVFMILGKSILRQKGRLGMINMHSWMFISSFETLRQYLLRSVQFDSLLHLGARTFDELSGEVVQNSAFVFINHASSPSSSGTYFRLIDSKGTKEKEELYLKTNLDTYSSLAYRNIKQSSFSYIPGGVFGYWSSERIIKNLKDCPPLRDMVTASVGIQTGDNEKFMRLWWEVYSDTILYFATSVTDTFTEKKWYPFNKGGSFRKWAGNDEYIVLWQNDGEAIKKNSALTKHHYQQYADNLKFKPLITWSRIATNVTSFRIKKCCLSDMSGFCLYPHKEDGLYALSGFLNSCVAKEYLNLLSPTLNFMVGPVTSLPIVNYDYNILNSKVKDCYWTSKDDWDAHETSWDFKTNELVSLLNRGLGTAQSGWGDSMLFSITSIELLLAEYKAKWTEKFNQLHANEEELNRQFIEIYGLQDELTPDVPLDEITILQQGEISIENNRIVWHDDVIIKQLLSYAVGCWMGRYRLDREGLNIAHYPAPEEVCAYEYNGHRFEIDDDAIIPLMGKDTPFEDDNALQKIVNFVKVVFGENGLTENLNFIEHCLGKSIEDYLIKDFWKDHKKMYQNRPIYWLFSSKKDAFQALVYMHRMNPYTAEKVRTKYLLPYIEHLKGKIEIDEARGSDLTTIERKNLAKMQTALAECLEYHDRLHEVAIQNINFDLDDGVVVNYAKFGDILAKIK